MKLHYRILWVDDKIEEIISLGIRDTVRLHLEDMEFITSIDCYETSESARKQLDNKESSYYDLIISDYNIDEGEKGDVLIKKIRDDKIFTEILFYSSEPEFNQKTIGLDRISYFDLSNDEAYKGFKTKILRLVNQTVSKLQELASIRGMVMTETSQLDALVEQILLDFFQVENQETEKLRIEILKKIDSSLKGNFRKKDGELVLKLAKANNIEIVKNRVFDASKKIRTIESLMKLKGIAPIDGLQNLAESYLEDVINVRNKLAHAKSAFIEGIECLVVDGDQPEKYDSERCKVLRRDLKKYRHILTQLQQNLAEAPQ